MKRRCCAQILSLVSRIKNDFLEQADLESILIEINRLITLVEKCTPFSPVAQDHSVEERRIIGEVVLKIDRDQKEIECAGIPGLAEYFPSIKHLQVEEIVEYLAEVQKNNICAECLRRSCPQDLCIPFVMEKRGVEGIFRHVYCQQERKKESF